MSLRDRILVLMRWLAMAGMGSWAGGTLYQMVEVVPVWSASPPESVRTFFRDTEFGRHKVRFFGPATMLARNLLLVAALVAAWPRRRRRGWLLLAAGCFAFGLVFTLPTSIPSTRSSSIRPGATAARVKYARWQNAGSSPTDSASWSVWWAGSRSCRRSACR